MFHLKHPVHSLIVLLCLFACAGSEGSEPPTIVTYSIEIDAGTTTGLLRPLWGDHYDLSYTHFNYASEAGFPALLASLAPRSWRCSVGRWEVGFPPPAGGDSTNAGVLQNVEREFYRGPNTLIGADDPANYEFTYLDSLLAGLVAAGVQPYVCFDYMPFTLALEQDPLNANNYNVSQPGAPFATLSYSNGIRTSPPSDPAVYARVVRNTMRHVRGLFAGATDFGVEWFEIGNEPDLVDATGDPIPIFWTATESDFFDMYSAIATEVDGDAQLTGQVQLGAGSFAFLPSTAGVAFLQSFLVRSATFTPRLDYLSFHSYGDLPSEHFGAFSLVQASTMAAGISLPWVNAEWGRSLNGLDPVYNQIEHGNFRAKVLGFMQVFPFVLAHEALLRDVGTNDGELGLLRTGPAAHKPVSHVYQALNNLNTTLNALDVSNNPSSLSMLSGRNDASSRVLTAIVLDDPGAGTTAQIDLSILNLPWGAGAFDVTLSRVTETSAGLQTVSTEIQSGGALTLSFQLQTGQQGLYLVDLVEP
ncbi:MAG: hypothetical protein ACI87O_000975 [Planctomycetota bacterium]|jgi:hypothetical protein